MSDEREKQQDEAVLGRMWDCDVELKRAAAAEGMSLWELSKWARKRKNKEAAAGLRVWADAATQLMLSRHRNSAVARLLQIAQTAQDETARKACVDAIKLNVIEQDSMGGGQMGGHDGTIEGCDDDELIKRLERGGIGAFERVVIADQIVSRTKVTNRFGWPIRGR